MRAMIVLILILSAGCVGDRSLTSWFTPEVKSQREPSIATAARVDQVGRQLAAANSFSGIDPTFQVIGHDDHLLFHRDRVGVFISDSLANECRNDAELAAVLASELGKMLAEQRNLTRMGYVEQFAQVPIANSMDAANPAADPVRMAELSMQQDRSNRKMLADAKKELTDPKKIAAELLRSAGHDEQALAKVEPLLRNVNHSNGILKNLGAAAGAEPVWSR